MAPRLLRRRFFQFLQANYTLGPSFSENRYHVGVVRDSVNKNLANLLPLMADEVVTAFSEELESKFSQSASIAGFFVPYRDGANLRSGVDLVENTGHSSANCVESHESDGGGPSRL